MLKNFTRGKELYEKLYDIAFPSNKCCVLVRWALSEYECINYHEGDYQLNRALDCHSKVESPYFVVTYLDNELSSNKGKFTSINIELTESIARHSSHKVIWKILLSRSYRKSGRFQNAEDILRCLKTQSPNDPNLLWEIKRLNQNA